jgi:hypothetical protein
MLSLFFCPLASVEICGNDPPSFFHDAFLIFRKISTTMLGRISFANIDCWPGLRKVKYIGSSFCGGIQDCGEGHVSCFYLYTFCPISMPFLVAHLG